MEPPSDPYEFTNGIFEWNHSNNELQFVSGRETVKQESAAVVKKPEPEILKDKYQIEFKDDIDLIDKIQFKRKFRRKEYADEPTVILMQDIKDVTIFTANPKKLHFDFLGFLHTPMVDKFFRSLIIYFQFYFQTWENLKSRREEIQSKIVTPVGSVLENIVRDDLSDLRCILAREYITMVIGSGDAGKWHHARSTMSMSERDRYLCECLIQFSTRLVWYALNRPSLSIIDQEIDRISRSWYFNKLEHTHLLQNKPITEYSAHEKKILWGLSDFEQKRLKAMTPVGKEIMCGIHDHRILSIGQVDFPPSDDRLRFLEKLYLLPEEEFQANGICIGILGMPRDNFDVMLKQKRKKSYGEEGSTPDLDLTLKIPPRIEYSFDAVESKYPTTPPRIQLNERQKLLQTQFAVWVKRIRPGHNETMKDYTLDSCTSLLLN